MVDPGRWFGAQQSPDRHSLTESKIWPKYTLDFGFWDRMAVFPGVHCAVCR